MFENLRRSLRNSQVWRSMFRRVPWTDTPRDRAARIFGNVWLHLHPVLIRPRAVAWTYTWGLGGLTFLLALVLTFTGVVLMFYYPPAFVTGFDASQDLRYWASFARFNSNVHAWAAEGMMLAAILHMARVFMTGAYKKPREFNWGVGVALLLLTGLLILTGKMIPWERLPIWKSSPRGGDLAGANLLVEGDGFYKTIDDMKNANDFRHALFGGLLVGPRALVTFYVLHCVALPFVFFCLVMVHFWRIRKDTFSAAPYAGGEEKLETWPHLIRREYLAAKVCLLALLVFGLRGPVPEASNSLHIPWWGVWIQVLLLYFDPWTVGRLMPAALLVGLLAIPYLDDNPKGIGYFSVRERPFAFSMFALGLGLWCLLLAAAYIGWGPESWVGPWEPGFAGIILMVAVFFLPRLINPGLPERRVELGGLVLLLGLAAAGWFRRDLSAIQAFWIMVLGWSAIRFAFVLPCRHLGRLDWPRYALTMALGLSLTGVFLRVTTQLIGLPAGSGQRSRPPASERSAP